MRLVPPGGGQQGADEKYSAQTSRERTYLVPAFKVLVQMAGGKTFSHTVDSNID